MRRLVLPGLLLAAAVITAIGAVLAEQRANDDEPPAASGTRSPGPTDTVAAPVLSPRRVPSLLVEPKADEALGDRLTDIVERSPEATCLVVRRGGSTIFAHNPDRWMVPASTQKLLTAAAALEILGIDHVFATETRATSAITDSGVLDGDLWLIGGGDPVLDTPGYLTRFPTPRPVSNLTGLADELVGAGLRQITGGVMGDESRYDQARSVASWTEGIVAANRAGPLSALMINDGFSSYPSDSPDNAAANPASDPPAAAAAEFDDLLEERGVTIEGGSGSGVVPGGSQLLATLESVTLDQVLTQMNTFSDNTTAELVVKELGVAAGGAGSTTAGAVAVSEAIAAIEAPTVNTADGSGLSRDNITTCATLTSALDHFGPESPLATSLAVAGETGTLATRFLDDGIRGRIRAKSGSLGDAAALAGLARASGDQPITFAFIVNGPDLDQATVDGLQNELAAALISWPEGPDAAAAGPQGS